MKASKLSAHKIMNKSRPFILLAIAAACIIAGLFSATIRGSSKVYEIRPQINIPEYQMYPCNPAMYQQLTDHVKNANENLSAITTNLKTITDKLDSIDAKLTQLSERLLKIESTLSLRQSQKSADPNQPLPAEK